MRDFIDWFVGIVGVLLLVALGLALTFGGWILVALIFKWICF